MNEFLKLTNKIVIKLKIIPLSPLNIKFSQEGAEGNKIEMLTTEREGRTKRKGEPYIPGSTLRGLFRDKFTDMLSQLINEKELEDFFGPINENREVEEEKLKKTRIFIQDTYLDDDEIRRKLYECDFENTMNRIKKRRIITSIDHFSSKAMVPLEYEYTMETFSTEIVLNNPSRKELQGIYFIIRDSQNNEIRIGNSKTRGFGLVKFEIEDFKYEQFKNDDALKELDKYFNINDEKSKKIGDKYLSKVLYLKNEYKQLYVNNEANDFIKALFKKEGN